MGFVPLESCKERKQKLKNEKGKTYFHSQSVETDSLGSRSESSVWQALRLWDLLFCATVGRFGVIGAC